jgi:glycosyltransferase involved in cell wall biosynthesis
MKVQSLQYSVAPSRSAIVRAFPDRWRWAIVTGDYDRNGGVTDYTRLIAAGLAAVGDEVTVCVPTGYREQPGDAGLHLAEIRKRFRILSLRDLDRALASIRPDRVLVQYVPQGYGWHGMNLPFCLWLLARRRRYSISMMFHEVAVVSDRKRPLRHNVQALVTHMMAALAARSAAQSFVSIEPWEPWLRSLGDTGPIMWLPIPANIPATATPRDCARVKASYVFEGDQLIGHFGSYGPVMAQSLMAVLPLIVKDIPTAKLLLIGDNSESFGERFAARFPELAGRVRAAGRLSAAEVSSHLGACDLMVQPYPDGITTRRTSAMACLAHALPVVTTTGHLTEPIWKQSRAVLMSSVNNSEHLAGQAKSLMDNAAERSRLGASGKALYEERFALRHTISKLRMPSEAFAR